MLQAAEDGGCFWLHHKTHCAGSVQNFARQLGSHNRRVSGISQWLSRQKPFAAQACPTPAPACLPTIHMSALSPALLSCQAAGVFDHHRPRPCASLGWHQPCLWKGGVRDGCDRAPDTGTRVLTAAQRYVPYYQQLPATAQGASKPATASIVFVPYHELCFHDLNDTVQAASQYIQATCKVNITASADTSLCQRGYAEVIHACLPACLLQVPSFKPDIRSQQLNRFAAFIGDERADNVRRQYGKPLRAIIITDSGVLPGTAEAVVSQQGALALTAGSSVELP